MNTVPLSEHENSKGLPIEPPRNRRPIWVRQISWAAQLSQWLIRLGLRPNVVSVLSAVFSLLGGGCLLALAETDGGWRLALPLAAIVCIGLRGLCNLLDGMMAVEGGFRTAAGEMFNELPDRFSDSVTLVCLGYSATWSGWEPTLGWAAALLAAITAFVRVLGVQAGAAAQFCGPMSKTARMLVVVIGCLGLMLEAALHLQTPVIVLSLSAVTLGCVVTIGRRTLRIVRELEAR